MCDCCTVFKRAALTASVPFLARRAMHARITCVQTNCGKTATTRCALLEKRVVASFRAFFPACLGFCRNGVAHTSVLSASYEVAMQNHALRLLILFDTVSPLLLSTCARSLTLLHTVSLRTEYCLFCLIVRSSVTNACCLSVAVQAPKKHIRRQQSVYKASTSRYKHTAHGTGWHYTAYSQHGGQPIVAHV